MSIFKKAKDNMGSVINKAQVGTAAINLEIQKKAKETTVQQAIQRLKTQKEGVFVKIGQQCYDLNQSEGFNDDRFSEYFGIISGIDVEIKGQETMLADIQKKFEEEIALLKGASNTGTEAQCKCGKPYKMGIDLFCAECGADLRVAQNFCPSCGNNYDPGVSAFCKKCGASLKADSPE